MAPHSSTTSIRIKYKVKAFGATQFEAVIQLLPEWFPDRDSSMDGKDLERLVRETLVPYTAQTLNGVTPLKGKDLRAALEHDDREVVLTPWSLAVEHLLGVLLYANVLSREGDVYYRGAHWVTMPHMTAEGMACLRRPADGGWWYERRPRPLGPSAARVASGAIEDVQLP